jgi:hypothetical protein
MRRSAGYILMYVIEVVPRRGSAEIFCAEHQDSTLKRACLFSSPVRARSIEGRQKPMTDAYRFCYNEPADRASFGYRTSLSHPLALQMAELFQMSPQFLSSMFGEFSYMAPGDFAVHDEHGGRLSLGKSVSRHSRPSVC